MPSTAATCRRSCERSRSRPDVVITDIRMPPTNTGEGIQAATALHERLRSRRHRISQYVARTTRCVFRGRDRGPRVSAEGARRRHRIQLMAAIREVAHGGSVVDPKVVDVLVEARTRPAIRTLAQLTPREREVLAGMAGGKSNAAIATSLFLTKRAVEKHINSIFSKLELRRDRRQPARHREPALPLGHRARDHRRPAEAAGGVAVAVQRAGRRRR